MLDRFKFYLRWVIQKLGQTLIGLSHRIYRTLQETRDIPWQQNDGDKALRLDYDLNAESIVFDLGGYEGQWSSDIFSKYLCTIHIFEPVPNFADRITKRFLRNHKVIVHCFGLAGENRKGKISLAQDGSSLFKQGKNHVDVQLVGFEDFIRENSIAKIDLVKINIEGGEYELLEHVISCGFISKINNIQVQFHDFIPNAEDRMMTIQNSLSKTHKLTYQFPFVWENWRLNS